MENKDVNEIIKINKFYLNQIDMIINPNKNRFSTVTFNLPDTETEFKFVQSLLNVVGSVVSMFYGFVLAKVDSNSRLSFEFCKKHLELLLDKVFNEYKKKATK